MADQGAAWRNDLEMQLRAAAATMRCAPLPREVSSALPVPIGRPPDTCPLRVSARAITALAEIVAAISGARLSDLQQDVIWSRALDLSWKEIKARHPDVPLIKLRRDYDRALLAIDDYLVENKRKKVSNHQDSAKRAPAP